jgi:D-beta-D-heptose 7-phosphate kinase/D-beta-D-heptose 1-phosphate adenosyltransferase
VTASGRPLLVVGDALLDRDVEGRAARLCPDAPAPVLSELVETVRPGGAGLAALLAALDGREVILVTAMGVDRAGRELRSLLDARVTVIGLPLHGATREKIRIRSGGQSLVRLDRGDGVAAVQARLPAAVSAAVADAFTGAGGVLVSDYGGGLATHPVVRELLCAAARTIPVVWDPHPRGARPVPGVRMATPNIDEARHFTAAAGSRPPATGHGDLRRIADDAARLVRAWRAGAVVVTMGARGALLSYGDGVPLVVPTEPVRASDACGAGDRFAATAAALLLDGALPSEATTAAVAVAREFVRHGGAAALGAVARHTPDAGLEARHGTRQGTPRRSAREVVAAVRAAGGTVVATGGCFDLLHAGHVSALRLARELGDCLVVCLNSDASVRRIKGPDRPLVPQEDRVRVLEALACVDAVVVFDEDDPGAVLAELRPDVWAKGGDYTGAELPEAQLVARWGGQVVLLPYLEGRSTTRLVRSAAEAVRGGEPGPA